MADKVCKKCGVAWDQRFHGRLCRSCYRAKQRDLYRQNPEKANLATMAWRAENPDQYRETQRDYHRNRYNDPVPLLAG